MVVEEWNQGGVEGEEDHHAECHAEEHVAGGGCSDVDAIPDEGGNSANREEECPRKIDGETFDDTSFAGEDAHKP